LYRLNETSKALEAINKAKNPELKHKELKAQILYRLEKFDDSYSVYRDILKNTSDDEFEVQEQINSYTSLLKH
jgi:signal recognition particle subunit SRP72